MKISLVIKEEHNPPDIGGGKGVIATAELNLSRKEMKQFKFYQENDFEKLKSKKEHDKWFESRKIFMGCEIAAKKLMHDFVEVQYDIT